jgi:His Kinase A (phospho-acceptor) domain
MMIPCGKLKPGMEVASAVVTPNQTVLLPAGKALTAEHLRALKLWGVDAIQVVGDEGSPGLESADELLAPVNSFQLARPHPSPEQLVGRLDALSNFVSEICSSSGGQEIMALTIRHLKALFPSETAGFYFPQADGLNFVLQTPLPAAVGSRLTGLVEQAIDSGEFGWTLCQGRPAAFKCRDGQSTLLLAPCRTHSRVWCMFAAILGRQLAECSANADLLAAHLALAAEAMLREDLTTKLQEQTQQLYAAEQAAELASQVKSQLIASLSHDLRTPLNAILGYTHILLRRQRSDTELDQLTTVQTSAEHLLSMLNELLNLAKAGTSAPELPHRTPGSGGTPVNSGPEAEAPSASSPPPALVLPPENLRTLKHLSADGDILELQKALAKMVGNSSHPLARRLLQLATQCRVKAVRELLETYERDHPDR